MERKVWLSAKVLLGGVTKNPVCPTCGGVKSIEAYTCKRCRHEDVTVTKAVKSYDEAVEKSVEGHAAAVASGGEKQILGNSVSVEVAREVLLPHVLANTYIPKNAQMRYPKNRSISPYIEMLFAVDGGHIKMFIFGGTKADIGQTVTGIVELKVKKEQYGNHVPYLRMQIVPNVVSTADISFEHERMLSDLPTKFWMSTLTRENGEKRDLIFTLGYKAVEVEVERKVAEV